ncbi:hypothetical protein BDN67DRAFT_867648, partial [Paxillus ammoniavirescens]
CDDTNSLINIIYPRLSSTVQPPPEYFLNRMILSARNSDVEDINSDVLTRMCGELQVHLSADTV